MILFWRINYCELLFLSVRTVCSHCHWTIWLHWTIIYFNNLLIELTLIVYSFTEDFILISFAPQGSLQIQCPYHNQTAKAALWDDLPLLALMKYFSPSAKTTLPQAVVEKETFLIQTTWSDMLVTQAFLWYVFSEVKTVIKKMLPLCLPKL